MCRTKSCLVLKNRVFCPAYDSHQDMLWALKIMKLMLGKPS